MRLPKALFSTQNEANGEEERRPRIPIQDPENRELLNWAGVLALATILSVALISAVAVLLEGRLGEVETEDRFLAVYGHRCLVDLEAVDVPLHAGWSGHWSRLGEEDCVQGSWLSQFRERGQNLTQYKAVDPNRGAEDSYLQMGPFVGLEDEKVAALVPVVREFLEIYFQLPVYAGAAPVMSPASDSMMVMMAEICRRVTTMMNSTA